MKYYPFIFGAILMVLVFIVMYLSRTHYGDLKTEGGVVFEKQYAPEINSTSTGVGVSSGGEMVVTSNQHYEPEKYLVFFRCDHGVIFFVQRKDLWTSLMRGDTVSISYYDVMDRHNKIVDYEFVNAIKR